MTDLNLFTSLAAKTNATTNSTTNSTTKATTATDDKYKSTCAFNTECTGGKVCCYSWYDQVHTDSITLFRCDFKTSTLCMFDSPPPN